ELVTELSTSAKKRFEQLHYDNIEAFTGNGYAGCPEHAPYDGIIVTAAATHIPEALITQLKPGGKLVIPIGLSGMHQELMLLEKGLDDKNQVRSILGVVFVPLIDEPVKQT
ncbi:MAG: protein-L-isoaspartate O-methyltransferase, partial [Gammaproteobacteria bacterium]|nr:protein-L-isoaspartate O-methyltransferase [Gammaproteobacteria bacterium]